MKESGLGGIAAVVLATVLALVTGTAVLTGISAPLACTAGTATPDTMGAAGFDTEQLANATTIATVTAHLGLPPRAAVIAIDVAITESGLRNLDHGDTAGPDSRGLFQQRAPWGPAAARMDPAAATQLFLTGGRGGQPGLINIPGWQTLSLAAAAQAVQHSALPQAYAGHETAAEALLSMAVGSGISRAIPQDLQQFVSDGVCGNGGDGPPEADRAMALPADFTLPPSTPPRVFTAVRWALAQLGTPYSWGGDCTAARSGDQRRECDCSSLVQAAYRGAGVALPRTTAEQVHAGRPVPGVVDLRPGDLIFIPGAEGTLDSPRHVGMAIGDGLLIQAPHTGSAVRLTRIQDWAGQIATIRRII